MKLFPITKDRYLWAIQARVPYGVLYPWSLCQQFTPFPAKSTATDSCVIGNGIPRSGTYLVNNILSKLGRWEHTGIHINPRAWDTWQRDDKVTLHPCLAELAMKKLRNGQIAGAHLPWSQSLERAIGQPIPKRRIKHIFIHRDPRDTFISYLNWTTTSEGFLTTTGGREFRKFMSEKFDDDDQRLAYIMAQPQHSPAVYKSYQPWLHSQNCLAVKFEDLYPEIYELRHGRLGPVFENLLRYLEIDATDIDLPKFSREVHGQSTTEIGQYQKVFGDHHYSKIDSPAFRNTLEEFGYTW